MSASYLLGPNDFIESARYMGTGQSYLFGEATGNAAIPATSTLTNILSLPQGLYNIRTDVRPAGAGAALGDLQIDLYYNGQVSPVLENYITSSCLKQNVVVGNSLPFYINTAGAPTVSTVMVYNSAGGALNPGADGFVRFNAQRVC